MPDGEGKIPTHVLVDMAMGDFDERGLNGGGQCKIRNLTQRRRPAKGRHALTRRAHTTIERPARNRSWTAKQQYREAADAYREDGTIG